MHFWNFEPSEFLKPYIKGYCFMESSAQEGMITERVIPIEGVQLMFHYKNPFVVHSENCSVVSQPRSILTGLSHSFSDVSTHGAAGVVFIQFSSIGACYFFDFPLIDVENQSINLADVFSKEISPIEEMLYLEGSLEGKVKIIESFLMKRFCPISSFDHQLLQTGIRLVKQTKGQITASDLSDQMAMTSKSLERKFSKFLGKTPKQFIKLIRYLETLASMSRHQKIFLTEHAYSNGYCDQSHFIKDFKAFTGYTPKEFLIQCPDYSIHADIW